MTNGIKLKVIKDKGRFSLASKSLEFNIRNWFSSSLILLIDLCSIIPTLLLLSRQLLIEVVYLLCLIEFFYYNNAKFTINFVMQARLIVVRQ
ncbi:hypothetical protein T4B_3575 [Trichinella pseudospiralis]|uniref:Uncharacterized protein n=1 Tax=Trichinella pseudospiralis TaxID=6337 RepID=A0A0V1IHP0_TRIPS|nr:hypothetical protein T4B_3575 [Trichinella pseudospiralis]